MMIQIQIPSKLKDVERRLLTETLRHHHGQMTAAAESLGVDRRTLYRNAKKFGINPADFRPQPGDAIVAQQDPAPARRFPLVPAVS